MRIRVTPQILSNTRRKAGLPAKGGSLVNYLQNRNAGGTSRLGAMNARCGASNRILRSGYEKLQTSAEELIGQAGKLSRKVEEGLTDISSDVSDFVGKFNTALKNLKSSSGVLNEYYHQTMKETVLGNQGALADIGITVASDGALTLNKDKLAEADTDAVKKVFGGDSEFLKRVSAVASRTADNAKAGAASFSSQYNAAGDITNSYLSRFNYKR